MTDAVSGAGQGVPADFLYQRGLGAPDSDPSAFMNVLDSGLGTISQRPQLEPQADQLIDGLSGAYTGEVGEIKGDLIGGDVGRAERDAQRGSESLEDRVRGIYTELTHYQVAWRIAQNVQRDVSQLLRGS